MPHFIMDCSESILKSHHEEYIMEQIHHVANSTGLFDEGDIKVKINPFQKYSVGNTRRFYPRFFSLFFAEPSLRVVLTVLCFPFIGIISVLSTIKTLCRRKPVKPSLLFSAIVSLLWLAFLLAGLVQYLGE